MFDSPKSKSRGRDRWLVKNSQYHGVAMVTWCGPGLPDGMVSTQGGSIRAGVRLCGVGRVMVLDRCRLSVCVRSRSRVCFACISNCMCEGVRV